MKVLHVITGLGVGGAELQLRSILQQTRHNSEVVTLYNPGPVADMIRADGGRVRDMGMTRNTQLSALLRLRTADPGRPVRRGARPPVPLAGLRPAPRPGWPARPSC